MRGRKRVFASSRKRVGVDAEEVSDPIAERGRGPVLSVLEPNDEPAADPPPSGGARWGTARSKRFARALGINVERLRETGDTAPATGRMILRHLQELEAHNE